jgi:hypothetical protein
MYNVRSKVLGIVIYCLLVLLHLMYGKKMVRVQVPGDVRVDGRSDRVTVVRLRGKKKILLETDP